MEKPYHPAWLGYLPDGQDGQAGDPKLPKLKGKQRKKPPKHSASLLFHNIMCLHLGPESWSSGQSSTFPIILDSCKSLLPGGSNNCTAQLQAQCEAELVEKDRKALEHSETCSLESVQEPLPGVQISGKSKIVFL